MPSLNDKRERALWLADKLVGDYGSEAAQLLRWFAAIPSAKVARENAVQAWQISDDDTRWFVPLDALSNEQPSATRPITDARKFVDEWLWQEKHTGRQSSGQSWTSQQVGDAARMCDEFAAVTSHVEPRPLAKDIEEIVQARLQHGGRPMTLQECAEAEAPSSTRQRGDIVERLRWFATLQERDAPNISFDLRLNAVADHIEQLERELAATIHDRDFWNGVADRLNANLTPSSAIKPRLKPEHVEWVVNDIAELGVKIGNQFFWLYKGHSLVYGEADDSEQKDGICQHDNGGPMHWRPVGKREFGECCHPVNYKDPRYIGTVSLDDSDEWKPLPAASASTDGKGATDG